MPLPTCRCRYEYIASHSEGLPPHALALVEAKQSEARLLAAHMPDRPLTRRPLRVREFVGFGASRWGLQLIAVSAEPLRASEHAQVARLQAVVRGHSARRRYSAERLAAHREDARLSAQLAAKALHDALFDALPVETQASLVAASTIASATCPFPSGSSRAERAGQLLMLRAKAAGDAGHYAEARRGFLDAFHLCGLAEALVLAAEMLALLGRPKEAAAEYEAILGRPGVAPDESMTQAVRVKLAEANKAAFELDNRAHLARVANPPVEETTIADPQGSWLEWFGAFLPTFPSEGDMPFCCARQKAEKAPSEAEPCYMREGIA